MVRGSRRALIVGDMPFLSYATPEEALENAGRFLRDAGVQAVKVEGGVRSARVIDTLVKAGIPFDLMAYPMRKHGIEDRPARIHLFKKMLEFWKQRL